MKMTSEKNVNKEIVKGIKLPPIEPVRDTHVKTITDTDPSFYSLVEGRPIKPNTSIHKYKQDVKNIAMKRTLHGFLTDEILRIDREMDTEKYIYETASVHFDEYQESFEKFLADDNNQTIDIMKKTDALTKELLNQVDEHKKVNYDLATLKSNLQYNNETLMILLSFQNFLNKASPILWQEKQNIKLDVIYPNLFVMESDIYRSINIDTICKQLAELPQPLLFFETSDQLIKIFNFLEKQNLNYLLVTEKLKSEKNKFMQARDIFRIVLNEELNFIQQKIKYVEDLIKDYEMREVEVKGMFSEILHNKIKYLVSSETALQIFNYVEFAYEHLISPNNTNLSSLDMTLALEREYDNLLLDISSFGLKDINVIERETYRNSEMTIKQAKQAEKLLKDVDKLTKRLKSSYEPSRRKVYE